MELIEKELGTTIEVKGYMILIKSIVLPEVTTGGIYLSDTYKAMEEKDYKVGLVVAMGPGAYQPKEKFPHGPYCKIGDWVHYSIYDRDPETINGHKCYYIADEKVRAVIPDISAVVRELRVPKGVN